MEDTEKLIKNYTEYMTLSVLPEEVIRQCSSRPGFELLKKGHEFLQNGEAEKAVECYRKAAEKGEKDSYFALSICYERGIGVPVDQEQAAAMLKIAVRLRKREMYEAMGAEACDNRKMDEAIGAEACDNPKMDEAIGTEACDNRKRSRNLLDREFMNILFSAEKKERIKRIVFGKKVSEQAFYGYYKDISADRDESVIGWVKNNTTLHIEADGMVTAPENCKSLFSGMNIECFECNDAFDTGNVTNMEYMFSECSNLEELDLSGFTTENVVNMRHMFSRCSNLEELDLSGFTTENVISMESMFDGCGHLKKLNLSGFTAENVTDVSYMFNGCWKMEELDLSGFHMENVKNMRCMFYCCSNLKSLDLSGVTAENVTNMRYMFDGCRNLEELDLSGFYMGNVKDMSRMFADCEKLKKLNLSGLDIGKVLYKKDMFTGCDSLPEQYKQL